MNAFAACKTIFRLHNLTFHIQYKRSFERYDLLCRMNIRDTDRNT